MKSDAFFGVECLPATVALTASTEVMLGYMNQ